MGERTLSYRECLAEKKRQEEIAGLIDAGKLAMAEKYLRGAKLHDGAYYYLYSELLGRQNDIQSSDRYAGQALSFAEELEEYLLGAIYHRLAQNAKILGNRDLAADYFRQSSEHKSLQQGKAADYSNYLLNLHYTEKDAAIILQAARGYQDIFAGKKKYTHNHHNHTKLRIGYISPDFRRHIVACFSQAFFQDYAREQFAVYAYSTCTPDDITRKMSALAVCWRDVHSMSDAEIADVIYQDEIDILVDLSGHTGSSCLPILAYKPAPCQISGIGYFSTTGLSAVDFFLTDKYTVPPGEEAYFTERLIRLPHSHLCYTPLVEREMVTGHSPCLDKGYVTLGTLNHFDKVTDKMLATWGRIMVRLPETRLFLKSAFFDSDYRLEQAYRRMEIAGIPLARVDIEGYSEDYWAAYERIDIALDTYPYPGGGTTCEALYMGVPVISLYGSHHHERFGYSLLTNTGINELACKDESEYEQCVIALASDRVLLTALRRILSQRFQQSPLMDRQAYMKDLEEQYWKIWRSQTWV